MCVRWGQSPREWLRGLRGLRGEERLHRELLAAEVGLPSLPMQLMCFAKRNREKSVAPRPARRCLYRIVITLRPLSRDQMTWHTTTHCFQWHSTGGASPCLLANGGCFDESDGQQRTRQRTPLTSARTDPPHASRHASSAQAGTAYTIVAVAYHVTSLHVLYRRRRVL